MKTNNSAVPRSLLIILLLVIGAVGLGGVRGGSDHNDDYLYNEIVNVEGNVQVVNQATQETLVRSGAYLIFQRADCKRCLIATTTDTEGKYRIRVSRGRYRLVVRDVTSEGHGHDVPAPDQPRYIDANNVVGGNRFDVKLVYPPSQLDRTLP